MKEIFELAVNIAQGLTGIFAFLVMCSAPFRKWLMGTKEQKKKSEEDAEIEREAVRSLLRSEINRIYRKYREDCQLHSFDYENVHMLYTAYKKMGGNSFIDKIWSEITDWEIIP